MERFLRHSMPRKCQHMIVPPRPEGWWDHWKCKQPAVSGTPFCLAHLYPAINAMPDHQRSGTP